MRMHHHVDFVGKHNANKRAYAMEGDEEMFCRVRSVAMGHKLAARLKSSASVARPSRGLQGPAPRCLRTGFIAPTRAHLSMLRYMQARGRMSVLLVLLV